LYHQARGSKLVSHVDRRRRHNVSENWHRRRKLELLKNSDELRSTVRGRKTAPQSGLR
jgi:hypothetical protein